MSFELLSANLGPMPGLITYGLYLLGNNPNVANKIYAEIKDIGDSITLDDIHKHPILTWTVQEITRMYPPGGGINVRQTTRDDILDGYQVPPLVNVAENTYRVHNDARYWKDPETFNPWRWQQPIVPGSWTPWGGGERNCAGKDFALFQGTVTMAHLIKNFNVEYTAKTNPPSMGFTLIATFKTPVSVKLTLREAKQHNVDEL